MAAVDLQDAYFHLDIFSLHQQYLQFSEGNNHFQYKVLSFGLSTAPRVFTKTMVIVAAYLHLQHVIAFPYIDDWLLLSNSQEQLLQDVQKTLQLLQNLELQINHKEITSGPITESTIHRCSSGFLSQKSLVA